MENVIVFECEMSFDFIRLNKKTVSLPRKRYFCFVPFEINKEREKTYRIKNIGRKRNKAARKTNHLLLKPIYI